TTPESEWFRRIAPILREIFSSDSFASRPYFDAPSVNALFDDYIANPGNHGTMMFWRLLNVELWMREFIDTDEAPAPQPAAHGQPRSEEHTSELQSRFDLVCGLLHEKKNS